MMYDVSATVFSPRYEGEQFLVVASAGRGSACLAQKSTWAATLAEARIKCCELARLMCSATRANGGTVGRIHCSHCPCPTAPHCR